MTCVPLLCIHIQTIHMSNIIPITYSITFSHPFGQMSVRPHVTWSCKMSQLMILMTYHPAPIRHWITSAMTELPPFIETVGKTCNNPIFHFFILCISYCFIGTLSPSDTFLLPLDISFKKQVTNALLYFYKD